MYYIFVVEILHDDSTPAEDSGLLVCDTVGQCYEGTRVEGS
jgi:hypothetical protein